MSSDPRRLMVFAGLAGAALAWAAPAPAQVIVPEDVVILMDFSGSAGTTGFNGMKAFATQLNETIDGRAETRLGIIVFASTVVTKYNLTDNQSVSAVDTAIANLTFLQGFTHTKDAVQAAINMFDAQSAASHPKALILLTDFQGDTNQDPTTLTSALAARDIPALVVGYGSTFPAAYYSTFTSGSGGQVSAFPAGPLTAANADTFLQNASSYFGLGVAPVPEPGSAALALAGAALGAVPLARRYRRRGRNCGDAGRDVDVH